MATNNSINNTCLSGFTANGGPINLATDATVSSINVGTGAGIKTTIIGSDDTTSVTTVQSGTGGIDITSGSTLELHGGIIYNSVTVTTTPYNAVDEDYIISVDTSSIAITVVLPTSVTLGRTYIVKDVAGLASINNITVHSLAGIDGSSDVVLSSNNASLTVFGTPVGQYGITGKTPDMAGVTTITGDTGGSLTGPNITFTGGTTGLSFGGSGTTETVSGTLVVGNGGTGTTTLTSHGVLLGNTTSAITATAAGTTGQVLTGVTGSEPIWQSPAAGTNCIVTTHSTATTANHVLNAGTIAVEVFIWSGGGGGGGAAAGSAGSTRGGTGGGTSFGHFKAPATFFGGGGASVSYTVGTGGGGGTGSATGTGANGSPGNPSNFGAFLVPGGDFGSGTGIGINGGVGKTFSNFWYINASTNPGGGTSASTGTPANITDTLVSMATGGGAGGGAQTVTGSNGSKGVDKINGAGTILYAGGAAGIGNTGGANAAGNGTAGLQASFFAGGTGGGGGGGGTAAIVGQAGGDGAAPGGGGGGGGGAVTLSTGGSGGSGATGAIVVIEYL